MDALAAFGVTVGPPSNEPRPESSPTPLLVPDELVVASLPPEEDAVPLELGAPELLAPPESAPLEAPLEVPAPLEPAPLELVPPELPELLAPPELAPLELPPLLLVLEPLDPPLLEPLLELLPLLELEPPELLPPLELPPLELPPPELPLSVPPSVGGGGCAMGTHDPLVHWFESHSAFDWHVCEPTKPGKIQRA